jgi:hypothetical protein
MNHSAKSSTNSTATVVQWTARLLSLVSLGFVLMLAIGEGASPLHAGPRDWARDWALGICFPFSVCGGMILAWWRPAWGGALTVAGLLGFYAVHFAISNALPRGPWFVIFASPGFFFLLSAWLKCHRRE